MAAGVIAVDGAKVALTVNKRIAQAKILGHAHHGVVDRGVAMGMVLAQDFTDDTCALFVRLVKGQPQIVYMAYRMRRCTGFSPSRTSGSARATITLMA